MPRTELAERWLRAPHGITAFGDGAAQYGPLHLYLVAMALTLFDREDAGRVVSLVVGVLSVIPLVAFTRRLYGGQAARVAGLALSAWGLHVQFSTTAASEALAVFLMLSVFALFARGLETGRFGPLAGAAFVLNLACAVRYDAWLYVPLLAVVPVVLPGARRLPALQAAGFLAACLPFPLLWMAGNYLAHGDPLYPVHDIDAFHRSWAASASGWNEVWLRAQGLGFWPVVAVVSLTPGVLSFGLLGVVTAWRTRADLRWVILTAAAPLAYYMLRTTVFVDFVPLARFMAVQMALLLPFVWTGYTAAKMRWGRARATSTARLTAVLAVMVPVAIGGYTFRQDGGARDALRPLSPTSTNNRVLMRAAAVVGAEIRAAGGSVALDAADDYLDVQFGFYAGVPDERVARLRWPDFAARFDRLRPDFLVRFERGALARQSDVALTGTTLTVRGVTYTAVSGPTSPVRVYRRAG